VNERLRCTCGLDLPLLVTASLGVNAFA